MSYREEQTGEINPEVKRITDEIIADYEQKLTDIVFPTRPSIPQVVYLRAQKSFSGLLARISEHRPYLEPTPESSASAPTENVDTKKIKETND